MQYSFEAEFEVAKVVAIALSYGLIFRRYLGNGLPTFDILDEYLDGIGFKVATAQWTGESWACIGQADCPDSSYSVIEKVFGLTDSRYFWEISK
ncbi:MAG: hypothetical protein HWQ38_08065 [Nostoc sp. NMS7]|uniref:hypothetical protein n=1 Tax=Nostoc sp. NMS7 TaxID=2815391 RepID=UPI002600472B|nr:hypothetical protein [Nostoc sp. NMS7]MBN3946437.1 hypothetical protein [Nostoc sp. NMS7]